MKKPYSNLRAAGGMAVCAVLFLLDPASTRAAGLQTVPAHVPPGVSSLTPIGALDPTNRLRLDIGLPIRNQPELDTLLQQLYDPASPNYHHYVTSAEFAQRFGPTEADYQAVTDFASANHLTVIVTHPNRTLVQVEGSVADIQKAFHVKMLQYNHPTEHRTFYAPDTDPTVDLNVSLVKIGGLDNYVKPHPKSIIKPMPHGGGGTTTKGTGSGPDGTFFAGDFRAAYAPGVTLTGTGQKVAIFELDGYFTSDIIEYEALAGLPNVPVTNVLVGGFPGNPQSLDGDGEVSLDIEMIVSMAPGIDQILVYEGFSQDGVLNKIATDNAAKQISCSWGWFVPNPDAFEDQIYKQYAAQGQTFYDASGDVGTTLTDNVLPPSDDPYITQVGGTTLTTTGPLGTWVSDIVWSWFTSGEGFSASTGGYSSVYPLPVWQQGISMTANGGSTSFRDFPDVAMTADNILVVYDEGAEGDFGGTSCAAPLWTAFTALINQQGQAYGYQPVGFICPALYALCKGPLYNTIIHDVTQGNNTNFTYTNQFFATKGYDLCDGWGTPTGSNLINALVPPLAEPVLLVVSNIVSGGNGNGVIDFNECNDLTFIITNSGVATATGIQGFLYSTTLGAIVAQSISSFPDLPPGSSGASISAFTLSTEPSFVCGTPIDLVLVLKCDQDVRTNYIQLSTGVIGPPVMFSNSTVTVIPENNFTGIFSPVTVSNLVSAAKITVSVYAAVEYDEGLNLQLISPNGTSVALTAYPNGFLGANYGSGCAMQNQTTFDDAAPTPITLGTAPFIGSFLPEQPLSTFLPCSGTNLNGGWQLNATEEFPGDPATLICWTLNVEPYVCQDGGGQCPGSDLSLTMTASPNPVLVTSNVVFNLTVSNAGPSSADNVVISQSLPAGFNFVETSNYPVQAIPGTNLLLSLGSMPVYGTANISVVTTPTLLIGTFPDLAISQATVGSTGTDPNPNNNTASASTLVTLPTADLAVSMTAAPASLLQGGLVTYTIVVTNNGPFTATGVVLTNDLPANAVYVSSTTSQGVINLAGVQFSLGSLAPGSNAVVTVTVSPTTTGNITDTAQVGLGPLETDPVLLNNTASFTVTVGPSADLGVSAVVTPSTVVAGANCTYVATVVNNGPNNANNVVFSQTIPGGTGAGGSTYVSSHPTNGVVVTNGSIIWNIGSMASGSTLFITNVVKTAPIQIGGKPVILSSTFSVFGQPGDQNTNNNVVVVTNLEETPTITIVPVGATLVSQSGGFNNGVINPGETVGIQLFLQNTGNVATTNVVGTLQATGGISLPSGSQDYGALAPGGAAVGGSFTFLANGTNGGTIVATLALQDGSVNLGTVAFTFYLPTIQTFWNTNPIYIPATNFVPEPDSGPALPYPSTLQVSNVTGFVSKVTVTVSNLNHTYPNDIGLLLVGPITNAVLMDDAVNYATEPAVNVDLTFDSTAALVLPGQGNLTSGTYQPADYNSNDKFTNAVAPPGTTNALAAHYSTNLASFNGLAANGVWALYAHDVAQGDSGGISNGWGVTITTITPINPTNSLDASIVASSSSVVQGGLITYFFHVTNNGATAVSAYLTNIVPAGLSFVSATGSPSNYTAIGQTNIYNLGTLNPRAGVIITNVDTAVFGPLQTVTYNNTITAGLPVTTFTIGANSATVMTTVTLPVENLAAGLSATPNAGVVGNNLTYTLTVTNLGPSNSLAISGVFPLTGLQLVSFTASQGNLVVGNGALQCSFGAINEGSGATVTLVATPTNAGTLSNTWTVSDLSDTNSAFALVPIANATPIIAALGDSLVTPTVNGAINANQLVTVNFTLTNEGTASTTKLLATLQASGGVTPTTTTQNYGAIPNGGIGTQPFIFTASGAPGATVTATLALTDVTASATNSLGSVSFLFNLPLTTSYGNGSAIIIPQFGTATPYPSEILVSGLTDAKGSNLLLSKVTVTLNGFAHTFPHDVNVLLDSPSGQELILMGHAGGAFNASNLSLTFDDAATKSLPAGQLVSGTYLPTDYAPVDAFPGLPPASAVTNLALFNGSSPNGYWSLYVYDDTPGNAGIITGGWSLGLTAVSTVNPPALLAASMISSPNPVLGGNYLSYQITVTNLGPDMAQGVVLTDTLPAGVTFSAATVSQGSYTTANTGGAKLVIANLGSMSSNAIATVTIRVIAGAAGTIVNTATASSTNNADLYSSLSTATNSTIVFNPNIYFQATNTAGGFQLTLLGQPSQTYIIQSSSDLINWTSVATNTTPLASPSFIYVDTQPEQERFYRAIHLPQ